MQNVLVAGHPDQPHKPQRAAGKVVALALGHAEAGIQRGFRPACRHLPQIYDGKHAGIVRRHDPAWCAAYSPKSSTQVVVPAADRRERSFERGRIQGSLQPKRPHHVECLTRSIESGSDPQALLHKRQRRLCASWSGLNRFVGLDAPRMFHRLRQSSERGAREQAVKRQQHAKGSGNAGHHLDGQQGMTAQVEEVVVNADSVAVEQFRPDIAQALFDSRARSGIGRLRPLSGQSRVGQRAAIELSTIR